MTQKPPPPDDDDDNNGDDDAQETYEIADAPDKDDDRFYMPLNEKPTRAMVLFCLLSMLAEMED